jgi:tRNA-modifying protein YgfZ
VPDRYVSWLPRQVVRASGPEAGSFLQGQLSQDVLALADGGSAWSWVLAPTGKVDALVRVTRITGDDWLLDTDDGWGEPLLARLSRFKLRTKVSIEALSWRVLGLRFRGHAGVDRQADTVELTSTWPGLEGTDRLGEAPEPPAGWRLAPAEEYERRRIVAGLPRMGAELTEKTIPAETGLIDLTVSFTKGCYTGQELVARIDSRGGHVPRHLRRLTSTGQLTPGTELTGPDGKVAGTVTSAARTAEGGWVGLGYVRRGVDPPATVRAGSNGGEVEILDLLV